MVLTAVTELGYVPVDRSPNRPGQRSGVLGLCFTDMGGVEKEDGCGDSGLWLDEVIRGTERAARSLGYAVLIAANRPSVDDTE